MKKPHLVDMAAFPVFTFGVAIALSGYGLIHVLRKIVIDAHNVVHDISDSAAIRGFFFVLCIPLVIVFKILHGIMNLQDWWHKVTNEKIQVPIISAWLETVRWCGEPFPPMWYDYMIGTLVFIIGGSGMKSGELIGSLWKWVRRLTHDPGFEAWMSDQIHHQQGVVPP